MVHIGTASRRVSFVQRFRVTARKLIYFQHRIAKLGPAYLSCNERQTDCTRRNADPRRGCPNCEWVIQYNFFLQELDAELTRLKGGTREGTVKWPRKTLLEVASEVAVLVSKYKRNQPKWTVITSMLVDIYRGEVSKKRAIDSFKHTEETLAQIEALKKRARVGQLSDEDDE